MPRAPFSSERNLQKQVFVGCRQSLVPEMTRGLSKLAETSMNATDENSFSKSVRLSRSKAAGQTISMSTSMVTTSKSFFNRLACFTASRKARTCDALRTAKSKSRAGFRPQSTDRRFSRSSRHPFRWCLPRCSLIRCLHSTDRSIAADPTGGWSIALCLNLLPLLRWQCLVYCECHW